MHVINVRNAHEALPAAVHYMCHNAVGDEKLVTTGPVTVCYQLPCEMLCFWKEVDINPFELLYKSLDLLTVAGLYSTFQVNTYGSLDMVVFGNLVDGFEPHQATCFSMLLQLTACERGIPPGRYWQVSPSWAVDRERLTKLQDLEKHAITLDPCIDRVIPHSPYERGAVQAFDIMKGENDANAWNADLKMFVQEQHRALGYQTTFFKKVAVPMAVAYAAFSDLEDEEKYIQAIKGCGSIRASDWRHMCEWWLERRWNEYAAS